MNTDLKLVININIDKEEDLKRLDLVLSRLKRRNINATVNTEEVNTVQVSEEAVMPESAPTIAPTVVPTVPVENIPTTATATTATQFSAVPTANTTFTVDDLIKAAQPLVNTVGLNALRDLLSKYGVVAINQLQPEQCNPFALGLRALGAAI